MQRRGTAHGRFGGQTLLYSCNLFRAAMLVVLAVSPTPAMILVVAFLAGIGHALFFPALNAFLPRLVGGRDSAVSANTWLSLSQTACGVVGPAVRGRVAGVYGALVWASSMVGMAVTGRVADVAGAPVAGAQRGTTSSGGGSQGCLMPASSASSVPSLPCS